MANEDVTTLTGLAVTLVALSRFIASTNPSLTPFLHSTLASAESAGIDAKDLELLRTVIKSVSFTADVS